MLPKIARSALILKLLTGYTLKTGKIRNAALLIAALLLAQTGPVARAAASVSHPVPEIWYLNTDAAQFALSQTSEGRKAALALWRMQPDFQSDQPVPYDRLTFILKNNTDRDSFTAQFRDRLIAI